MVDVIFDNKGRRPAALFLICEKDNEILMNIYAKCANRAISPNIS
jgi:hypothetical protein